MATHNGVAMVGVKQPLGVIRTPTITPKGDEVRVRVEWTASTPLDLHQNDSGLLVQHPQLMGSDTAGTVVEVGPNVKRLKVGDKVFGFTWRSQQEKAHQDFCTTNEWLFGKLPEGFTLAQAITLPDNFVTVFHAVTTDLGLDLPWPKPETYAPKNADSSILIWGGASSVGQFTLQILRHYGYTNVIATASRKNSVKLQSLGAKHVFDYRDPNIVSTILGEVQMPRGGDAGIPLILDCIGSKDGSIKPISKLAKTGSKVAILLPVIVKDSTDTQAPEYEMDVTKATEWEVGVDARGVRTHFYLENDFFKFHLQSDIMPTMLKEGIVEPQSQKIIEGKTMLERAQAALNALRRKEASMERLVWKVSDA